MYRYVGIVFFLFVLCVFLFRSRAGVCGRAAFVSVVGLEQAGGCTALGGEKRGRGRTKQSRGASEPPEAGARIIIMR